MTAELASLEEIQGEGVQVVVHRHPSCKIQLEVRGSSPLIDKARKEAIRTVNKGVQFPGFRKGKAPEAMVVRDYPQAVEQEWQRATANELLNGAIRATRLNLLQNGEKIRYDLKKLTFEEAEYTFRFEVQPTIPSVDPTLFVLQPIEKQEVTEQQVDEAIREARFFFAEWKDLDRPIAEGDYIRINLNKENGEPVFEGIRFEVSKERMAAWMQKAVIGAQAGDTIEAVSEPDEKDSELTAQNVVLTILEAQSAILPELNEEFAKKMGTASMEEVRVSIKKMLQEQVDAGYLEKMREQTSDFLINQYPFDLPESVLEAETNHRKQKSEDPVDEETIRQQAVRAVRLFFITRKVINDAQIPITQKEVQTEAIRLVGSWFREVDPSQISETDFARALSMVILRKVQDYILAKKS